MPASEVYSFEQSSIGLSAVFPDSSSQHNVMSAIVKTIKIIKRDQREPLTELPEEPVQTENQVRREMVKTIASWIIERRNSNDVRPAFPTPVTRP